MEKEFLEKEFLTVQEVAAILRLNTSTVRTWCRTNKISHFKLDKNRLIKRADLEKFIEQRRNEG